MANRKKIVIKKNANEIRKTSRAVSIKNPKVHPEPKSRQKPKRKHLKLTVDLVPQHQWYKNLRKQLRPGVWDKLRKQVYAQAKGKCNICGGAGMLNCHEKWEFDEKTFTQRLVGLEAVCKPCHLVTHLGMSAILADKGVLDFKQVVLHFIKVNQASRRECEEHFEEAEIIWKKRSKFNWTMDYGQWASLIPPQPLD